MYTGVPKLELESHLPSVTLDKRSKAQIHHTVSGIDLSGASWLHNHPKLTCPEKKVITAKISDNTFVFHISTFLLTDCRLCEFAPSEGASVIKRKMG